MHTWHAALWWIDIGFSWSEVSFQWFVKSAWGSRLVCSKREAGLWSFYRVARQLLHNCRLFAALACISCKFCGFGFNFMVKNYWQIQDFSKNWYKHLQQILDTISRNFSRIGTNICNRFWKDFEHIFQKFLKNWYRHLQQILKRFRTNFPEISQELVQKFATDFEKISNKFSRNFSGIGTEVCNKFSNNLRHSAQHIFQKVVHIGSRICHEFQEILASSLFWRH